MRSEKRQRPEREAARKTGRTHPKKPYREPTLTKYAPVAEFTGKTVS